MTTDPATAEQAGATRPPRLVSPLSVLLAAATPAVTVPMLWLSRYWSDHGAVHSIGDMVPLALGGGICMATIKWTASDDSDLIGPLVGVAGFCVAIGSMAFPAGGAQPVITAAFATFGGWWLSWRVARENRKVEREFANQQANRNTAYDIAKIQAQTAIGVATIRGQADVQVAQINGATALGVADRNVTAAIGSSSGFSERQLGEAWQARRALDATPAAPAAVEAADTHVDPRDEFFGLPASLTGMSR